MRFTKPLHVSLFLLLAVAGVAAQQATFKSAVTLVPVDVTVLDKDGRPVRGLTADDFHVKLNGKLQPVRTLDYVEAPLPDASASPTSVASVALDASSRRPASNAIAAKDPKVLVIAVDDLSLPPEGGRRTLTAARRFVDAQPASVLIGVTTTTGYIAVNPTLDRAAVADALSHVVGAFVDPRRVSSPTMPSLGISEAVEIGEHNNTSVLREVISRECRDGQQLALDPGVLANPNANAISTFATKCATDVMSSARLINATTQGITNRQVAALSSVLGAMKTAPGLKQMVIVSQGVATTRDPVSTFDPIAKAAAAAGVQLSVLMEDDDDGDASNQQQGNRNDIGVEIGGSGIAARKREDRRMFAAALQTMADTSGGTFERVISSPDDALKRAALAGSAVYRLGVEAPAGVSASKPIQVIAEVSREGLNVHANHSAMLPVELRPESAAERVAGAIKHGTPYYGVPLKIAVTRRRAADNQIELGVGMAAAASVPGPLQITIGVLDAKGALKQGARALPTPANHADYLLTVPMPVAPGKQRVRLAAQDAAGNVGSVEVLVDAELVPMGTMLSSDLLTWWKDASGRPQFHSLDELPASITNLSAGLELYRTGAAPFPKDARVKLSIVAAGAAAPLAEVDLTPRADGDVLRAEAALPIGGLPPNTYLIRATVSAEGQRLGEVSAVIKKR